MDVKKRHKNNEEENKKQKKNLRIRVLVVWQSWNEKKSVEEKKQRARNTKGEWQSV